MPYPPLSDDVIAQCFPLVRPNPIRPGALELGLCLGGTVSAGAYTAGVLDFLIEALDAWTRGKEDKSSDAPPHEVVISTIAGASGGAINGAILLRGAGWEFDHGPSDNNPFYTAWTEGVDLTKMLGPAHNETKLVSVFNTEAIEDQVRKSIAFTGRKLGSTGSPHQRSYFADPLRLITMVGNVTGLPYSIAFGGESGLTHDLVAHADWMRFALSVPGGVNACPQTRPDELALCSDPNSPQNWDIVGKATLATSAFPLAFNSRPLSRLLEQCRYRVEAVPGEAGPGSGSAIALVPRWDTLEHGESNATVYNFVNVDGGTVNNQPLDMVRTALSGLDGRNPRGPAEADRAVILIDPFSDPLQLGPTLPPTLVGLLMPFVMSLVYQARYKPTDIALAYDESRYSRYLIAPVGPSADNQRTVGKDAIASGGLGGFLGFLDPAFMRYDFALGRLNGYSFVKQHLALPEAANNPIFASWTGDQRKKYRFSDSSAAGQPSTDYLPLIPLMDSVQKPSLPEWPKISDLPAGIAGAIDARLNAVFALAKADAAPDSWWKSALQTAGLSIVWSFVRPRLRDYALTALRQALIDQKLMRTT